MSSNPIQTMNNGGGNMMDFMKTQLMTMMMMKSMNSPQESNTYIAETPAELKDIIETIYKKTITNTITPEELFKHRNDAHVKGILDKIDKIEEKKGKDRPFDRPLEGLFEYNEYMKDFNSMKSTLQYDTYPN